MGTVPLRREVTELERGDLAERVAALGTWYHTLALAPGLVTPGFFDLRPVVDQLPWPDVDGRRCLDVATMDGFYAFELERRGAEEVVAIDIEDQADLDWLPRHVPPGFRRGQEPSGERFAVAHEALGSGVRRVVRNVYDLDPDDLGTFDVVVVGALMEHLRDPWRALEAVRSVTRGALLAVERVDLRTSVLDRRTPVLRIIGHTRTWAVPNRAGHLAMLDTAGFDVVEDRLVGCPLGPHVRDQPVGPGLRGRIHGLVRRAARRRLTGTDHWPFSAVLARPAGGLNQTPG